MIAAKNQNLKINSEEQETATLTKLNVDVAPAIK